MLTIAEIGKLLRGNRKFWFKRVMTALVPGCAFLLFGSPSFLTRLAAGLVFLFAGPMSASWFLVGSVVEPVIFAIRFRKSAVREDEDFASILKHSGVKVKRPVLKIVKGLNNAFTNKATKSFTYGEELYNRQTREERQVTLGHEVGHIISPFLTKRTAGLLVGASFLMLSVTSAVPDFFAVEVVGMSVMYLVLVPMRWESEYAADEHACRLFGPKAVITGLENLVPPEKLGIDSDSHPSINRRVKRIKRKWNLE